MRSVRKLYQADSCVCRIMIAIHKIQRLTWHDEFHFMDRVDSLKRVKKLAQKTSKVIGLQYERVVELSGKALIDITKKSGKTLRPSEFNELMYGDKGLITEAVEYGKSHAAK